ncbi:MAG: PilZ domain-containing protein [Candidatus Omnitrophota bacterium]
MRKADRQSCTVPIEGPHQGRFSHACVRDISRGGVGLISQEEVAVDQQIAVELELSPEGDTAVVMGRVKWVRPDPQTGGYRVGLKFGKVVDPGSRSRIKHYFEDKK